MVFVFFRGGGGGGNGGGEMEREAEAMGLRDCMWVSVCGGGGGEGGVCARVTMQGRRRDRVRYVMHY